MDINKTGLGSYNRVNPIFGRFINKCSVKRCKHKPCIMLFVDDGKPMMSRLFGNYCPKHLIRGIKEAWIYNNKKLKQHKIKTSGWTKQKSKCDYAVWWDCSFLCSNKKINPKKELVECKYNCPDFKKCQKEK